MWYVRKIDIVLWGRERERVREKRERREEGRERERERERERVNAMRIETKYLMCVASHILGNRVANFTLGSDSLYLPSH